MECAARLETSSGLFSRVAAVPIAAPTVGSGVDAVRATHDPEQISAKRRTKTARRDSAPMLERNESGK